MLFFCTAVLYVPELSHRSVGILLTCYMFIGLMFWGVGRSYSRSFPTEPWLCSPLLHPLPVAGFHREQLEVRPWSVLVPRERFVGCVVDAFSLYIFRCAIIIFIVFCDC